MNDQLQSAMRRAQKLLAIAGDDRANPNEAASAAAMAEKLMRKFSLEHADVMSAEFKKEANFSSQDAACVMKKGKGHKPKNVPPWAQWLAVPTAQLHDVQARNAYNAELGACIRFLGFTADVQLAAWSFDYLTTCVIRATRAFQKEATRSKVESDSFRRGFVMALLTSLRNAIDAKAAELAESSAGTSLMIVKADAVAAHFGEVSYGSKASKAQIAGDAFHAGRVQGAQVNVTQAVLAA